MPIPEAQLEIWSRQGASGPSRDTYASVKQTLQNPAAPFANRNPRVFLQGSYGNDTNVARDSDVDIVACLSRIFGHDAETLPPAQNLAFQQAFSTSTYLYADYKAEVGRWLIARYGNGVRIGEKAIYIPAGANRRECDVLPAFAYRYYLGYTGPRDDRFIPGICFYLADGTEVVNFPEQHSDNCIEKHQSTNQVFKRLVRVYKNMRNYLVGQRRIDARTAPSYFIEGMLHNAPNHLFGGSYQECVVATFDFIANADRTLFKCANQIHRLLGESRTSWPSANCTRFLDAIGQLWRYWA